MCSGGHIEQYIYTDLGVLGSVCRLELLPGLLGATRDSQETLLADTEF
jgi:hypothetical protein